MAAFESFKETIINKFKGITPIRVLCYIALIFFVFSSFLADKYEFVNPSPFWKISLIITLAVCAVITLRSISTKQNILVIIFIILFSTILTYVFVGSIIKNLNHYLDPTEPQTYTTVILKENTIRRTRRRGTTYKFTVILDGKQIVLTVPVKHYREFDQGDLYVVEYHKGAFNEPYYIGRVDE